MVNINIIPKILKAISNNSIFNYIDNLNIEAVTIPQEDIQIRKEFSKKILKVKAKYLLLPLYNKIIYPQLKMLEQKIMSQYLYDFKSKKIQDFPKDKDEFWDIRKDQLNSGNYKKYKETLYNYDISKDKILIYAYDIQSIDRAKEIIENIIIKEVIK